MSVGSARLLLNGLGIIVIGVLVALTTDIAVSALSVPKLVFILGGVALLIPAMVVEDPKAYWLFLLVLSIPFDISKYLSNWLVDSDLLVATYGQPAAGTASIELYVTDVVLIAMLLPWLARVCVTGERLFFPKIGYIFILYLAWGLLGSLINADSLYLSIFELFRQCMYFLFFVYLINNVSTRLQFRSVVSAVLLGLIIGSGSVIVFFERGVGTENSIFAGLHDLPDASSQSHKTDNENLTLHGTEHRFGPVNHGESSELVRSQGIFKHPAIAAGMFGLTLPIVLAYLLAARNNRDRVLFSLLFAWGLTALVLTFSRAGLIGLMASILVFFPIAGWSGLISRRVLKLGAVVLIGAGALSMPLLLFYFEARPGSFLMRFYLFEAALQGYLQHPLLGVGVNNATAAMRAGKDALKALGIPMPPAESADSFYLVTLSEVGPLGFTLFFAFFGNVVLIALRAMREVAGGLKPLLVGMVAGFASLTIQNFADDTLEGHGIGATLWLFAGLIIAIARQIRPKTQPFPARAVGLNVQPRGGDPFGRAFPT